MGVVVLEAVLDVLLGKAERFEQALGATGIDHVGGEGFGDLADSEWIEHRLSSGGKVMSKR